MIKKSTFDQDRRVRGFQYEQHARILVDEAIDLAIESKGRDKAIKDIIAIAQVYATLAVAINAGNNGT